MKLGFIGLGTMGGPMALRLADAGCDVLAFDVSPDASRRVADHPRVAVVADPCDLAVASAVVTMLPDGAAVRAALVDSGLLARLAPETVVVDTSSSAPAGTVELGRIAARGRVALLDAPVSGNPTLARDGGLTLMVGGDRDAVTRVATVLPALGRVHLVGTLGSGHALKALNNLLSSINLAAAAEVMLAGHAFGLDPDVMLTVINQSTGRNHATETKFAPFVLSGTFDSGFALGLMRKDIRIATELLAGTPVPGPFSAVCRELWERACASVGGERDNVEVVRWIEGQAGAELRSAATSRAGRP